MDNLLAEENLKYKSDVECQRADGVGIKTLNYMVSEGYSNSIQHFLVFYMEKVLLKIM